MPKYWGHKIEFLSQQLFRVITGGVKLARVYFPDFVEKIYKTLICTDYRERMKFVFNFLDIDQDGIIKAQDLSMCIESVNMDTRFGKELQVILDYYTVTFLRPKQRPKLLD